MLSVFFMFFIFFYQNCRHVSLSSMIYLKDGNKNCLVESKQSKADKKQKVKGKSKSKERKKKKENNKTKWRAVHFGLNMWSVVKLWKASTRQCASHSRLRTSNLRVKPSNTCHVQCFVNFSFKILWFLFYFILIFLSFYFFFHFVGIFIACSEPGMWCTLACWCLS